MELEYDTISSDQYGTGAKIQVNCSTLFEIEKVSFLVLFVLQLQNKCIPVLCIEEIQTGQNLPYEISQILAFAPSFPFSLK